MSLWICISLIAVVLLIGTNAWWIYNVLRPLRRLAAQTENLSQGNLLALQQPCGGITEIRALSRSMGSMAEHVQRAQTEGTTYRHALSNGQEAERARIARELHDDTVQTLIAISQSIDLASNWLERDQGRAVSMLRLAREQAVESAQNLRRMIANLRPPALEELGLIPALKMLAKEITGIGLDIQVDGIERRLGEAQELVLFRGAQEAIRNAQKHSQAEHAKVTVCYQPTEIRLSVHDDGVGFSIPERLDDLAEAGHYGVMGIYERVHSLNGTVKINSAPGRGTSVEITLPVTSKQPSETVHDPVCGADIHPQQAYGSVVYEGERYYFCCPVCQGAFKRSPETYLVEN